MKNSPIKGKKAFAFTLDAALAAVIIIMFLAAFSRFSSTTKPYIDSAGMKHLGDDAALTLEKFGILGDLNNETIKGEFSTALPPYLSSRVNVSCGLTSFELGNDLFNITTNRSNSRITVASGRMFFADNADHADACIFRFYIWPK